MYKYLHDPKKKEFTSHWAQLHDYSIEFNYGTGQGREDLWMIKLVLYFQMGYKNSYIFFTLTVMFAHIYMAAGGGKLRSLLHFAQILIASF